MDIVSVLVDNPTLFKHIGQFSVEFKDQNSTWIIFFPSYHILMLIHSYSAISALIFGWPGALHPDHFSFPTFTNVFVVILYFHMLRLNKLAGERSAMSTLRHHGENRGTFRASFKLALIQHGPCVIHPAEAVLQTSWVVKCCQQGTIYCHSVAPVWICLNRNWREWKR